jgi:hypothetical protein
MARFEIIVLSGVFDCADSGRFDVFICWGVLGNRIVGPGSFPESTTWLRWDKWYSELLTCTERAGIRQLARIARHVRLECQFQ